MTFVKGDAVKLVGFEKQYEVLVTGPGMDDECFAGVITKTEYGVDEYHGVLSVGTYENDYCINEFVLVGEE